MEGSIRASNVAVLCWYVALVPNLTVPQVSVILARNERPFALPAKNANRPQVSFSSLLVTVNSSALDRLAPIGHYLVLTGDHLALMVHYLALIVVRLAVSVDHPALIVVRLAVSVDRLSLTVGHPALTVVRDAT